MTVSAPPLVEPAFQSAPEFTQTLGPEVADLAELAGFAPDPEQRLGLDLIFAMDRRGRPAATAAAVVCARQNMKTGLFKQAALGWLFITDQNLVVWSAHEFDTALEALLDMANLLDGCQYLSRRVKRILYANGQESIELMTGQRLKFKARTRSGGRGLTGDVVVLDEAFALPADHMGALMPALSVRPEHQLIYGSSAGKVGSDVLRGVRDRGRAGTSQRLAYLEWCAPQNGCADERCLHDIGTEGCALDDRHNWHLANPLLGRVRANGTGLAYETLEDERQELPPQEFARERLGWWDEPGTAEAFGAGKWEACATTDRPSSPVAALAVAVSFDQAFACIAAASSDGHVKPLVHGRGTSWVAAESQKLQVRYDVDVVVDTKGPAASLIRELEDSNVSVYRADTTDVLDACASIHNAVQDGDLSHGSYPELDTAVAGAVKRTVGDRWAWGRKQSTSDISPLEAVTLAAWLAQTPATSTLTRVRGRASAY